MSAVPNEQTIRAWFEADGWRLEADELRTALAARGADTDLTVELIDEGADRRRRQPAPTTPPAQLPAKREDAKPPANVVPITDAPSSGNVPPQNKEAEEHVLGSMMISPGAISACTEILDADGSQFYYQSHGRIWKAALALDEQGQPVDVITLTDWLEQSGELEDVGGRVRLHELAALVPASANAPHYARIVKETATLRGLIRAGGEIARLGWERPGETAGLVDEAQQITHALGDSASDDRTEHVSILVKQTFAEITARQEAGTDLVGMPTGFRSIDRLTGGLRKGNLIVIAARPSMGKTGLLHAIMRSAAVQYGLPVGMFTIEMSKAEVTGRMLAQQGHLDVRKLLGGVRLEPSDWPRLTHAANALSNAPLFVNDKGDLSLANVRSIGRRMKQQHPELALIAVDFLQIMSGHGENRTQEVSKLSRGLKILARELEIPVIAVSQLSRAVEQRINKRPVLSDLRESGSIEQDADLVAFLYRDEYYNDESDQQGIAEFIVAKHRNGPTETLKLAFQKSSAGFSDLVSM